MKVIALLGEPENRAYIQRVRKLLREMRHGTVPVMPYSHDMEEQHTMLSSSDVVVYVVGRVGDYLQALVEEARRMGREVYYHSDDDTRESRRSLNRVADAALATSPI